MWLEGKHLRELNMLNGLIMLNSLDSLIAIQPARQSQMQNALSSIVFVFS